MPHTAPQPLPDMDLMAEAAKLREAKARGARAAQQARAQEDGGVVGQSGTEAAALADAVGETGRGGVDGATRLDIEVEAGQGDAASAARPATGEETGGDVQEYLASQAEAEALVPEPGMEGAPVSEPTEARDEGIVVAVLVQTTQGSMVPVVQLPDSSEEYGDSMDIDPAAAASAAEHIAEFASASADVLNAGTSEGPHHGVIIPSRVPSKFLRNEKEEEEAWNEKFDIGSQILQSPRPRLPAPSEDGLPGQPGKYFPQKIARVRLQF